MVSNPSKNDGSENQRKSLMKCSAILTKYFKIWAKLPGQNQVSKGQLGIYVAALKDLSPEQVEHGCQEATRNAERFPWPGHIRKAALTLNQQENAFLGPPLLEYPPVSEEDRIAGLAYSKKLREALAKDYAKKPTERKKRPSVVPSIRSLEEQKEILRKRGWL